MRPPAEFMTVFHYKGQKRGLIELGHAERPRLVRACCPASRPTTIQLVFRLTEPATLPPSRSTAPPASSRLMRVERAGDDERLARQRLHAARRSPLGASSSVRTPAAASRSMSACVARLVEKRPDRRRDDLADVRHGLQAARPTPHAAAPSIRNAARKRPRAALADVPDADAVQQPPELGAAGSRSISATRFAADFLPMRSSAASWSTVERVEVGVVADEALRDELVDERLAEPFDVHRPARREVLEAAADARRARDVLAAPDDFFLGLTSVAAAERTGGRHLPWRRIASARVAGRARRLSG